jgi:hypothetical protein
MAKKNGLNPNPKIVAELGPGDSLGIGLSALISGCDKYFAFDVVEHANVERNLKIFDEIVELFRKMENIPDANEFPKVKPYLESYDFPKDILNNDRLATSLEKKRIDRIRNSIADFNANNSMIKYKVPWDGDSSLEKNSIDMIYSQAVLEHVDYLCEAYKSMRLWLKPSGYISHQIDFKCHGTADEWNGHWGYSDFVWKLIRGGRAYLLNREPHSTHISILSAEGYKIVCDMKFKSDSRLTLDDLAIKFKDISNDDLTTSGAFIQAVKI